MRIYKTTEPPTVTPFLASCSPKTLKDVSHRPIHKSDDSALLSAKLTTPATPATRVPGLNVLLCICNSFETFRESYTSEEFDTPPGCTTQPGCCTFGGPERQRADSDPDFPLRVLTSFKPAEFVD